MAASIPIGKSSTPGSFLGVSRKSWITASRVIVTLSDHGGGNSDDYPIRLDDLGFL